MKPTALADATSQPRAHSIQNCSFEITARGRAELGAAAEFLRPGAELFVANVPNDPLGVLVDTSVAVRRAGYVPVPHIVARNIAGKLDLENVMARLAGEAGVDRMLILGGDRDKPIGGFTSALEVLESGVIQERGIARAYFACYPERHPRIAENALRSAVGDKLAVARRDGIDVTLISQFAFEAAPIVAMIRRLRESGVTAPVRVGIAGRINRAKLLRYALRCGVGPSIRTLRDRKDLAIGVLTAEAPDALVADLAAAEAQDPTAKVDGIHLFTFGALAESAQWVRDMIGAAVATR